jgi:hypothetical protein
VAYWKRGGGVGAGVSAHWRGPLLFVVTASLLAVAIGLSNRYPVPGTWLLVAFAGVHLGAGLLFGQWRAVLLALAWVPLAILATGILADPLSLFILVAVSVPVTALLIGLGVGVAKLTSRPRGLQLTGAGLMALALLPVPVALLNGGRTVTVDRPQVITLDERSGTLRGVGLGDSRARVEGARGRAPRWDPETNPSQEPLDADENANTSSAFYPDVPGDENDSRDTYLRYRGSSFYVHRGRVRSIEITDRSTATSRGVGPGDSMSLVEKAYPELRCGQRSYGSDADVPYPYCAGRVAPGRYIHFNGDYTQGGQPVVAVTIADRPLQ